MRRCRTSNRSTRTRTSASTTRTASVSAGAMAGLERIALARRSFRCTSPTATRPRTTWSSRRPQSSEAACSRLRGSTRRRTVAEPRHAGRGARGIKLHPRAEQFTLDDPAPRRWSRSLMSGGCRSWSTPAARSRRSGATPSSSRALSRDRLILAHAGISDLAWIWRETADYPNLFFDTAWWSPSDVQAPFELVPPGQILLARDAPYGSTTAPGWRPATRSRPGSTPSRPAARRRPSPRL